jgi:hypothetical protein
LKCYELQGPGGIGGLALVDKPVPEPGEGQVLVRQFPHDLVNWQGPCTAHLVKSNWIIHTS